MKRLRQGQHLLLAARQVAGHLRAAARPRIGNSSSTSRPGGLDAGRRPCGTARPASRRFSSTVRVGNTPLPPGISDTPAPGHRCRRRQLGDVLGRRDVTVPAVGSTRPQMRLEQRRLAGAVGAEQGDDLARVDVEVDAEEDLHRPVGHVESLAASSSGSLTGAASTGSSAPASRSTSSSGWSSSAPSCVGGVAGVGHQAGHEDAAAVGATARNRSRTAKATWPRPPGSARSTASRLVPVISEPVLGADVLEELEREHAEQDAGDGAEPADDGHREHREALDGRVAARPDAVEDETCSPPATPAIIPESTNPDRFTPVVGIDAASAARRLSRGRSAPARPGPGARPGRGRRTPRGRPGTRSTWSGPARERSAARAAGRTRLSGM